MCEMKLKAGTPNGEVMQACRLCSQLTRRFGTVGRHPADQPCVCAPCRCPALPARGLRQHRKAERRRGMRRAQAAVSPAEASEVRDCGVEEPSS